MRGTIIPVSFLVIYQYAGRLRHVYVTPTVLVQESLQHHAATRDLNCYAD